MSQMDSSISRPAIRRRPSIHRSWNDINLTDDQKQTTMSDTTQTEKSNPSSPAVLRNERVSNEESEDSMNDSDQESYIDQDESSVYSEVEDEEDHIHVPNINRSSVEKSGEWTVSHNSSHQQYNHISIYCAIFFILVTLLLACFDNDAKESFDLESIKQSFPTQDDDLWIAFEAGVEDVVRRERPSTFILLFEEEHRKILNELVYKLSKFAACNITDCMKEPIEVTDTELNSAVVVRDYGTVIEKYRDKLEEKGVMVIRNLEKVRGTSAQAFHSFCDEFTPLVHKSLFIFTMKVEEMPRTSDRMRFIEEYFKTKWTDIKVDAFNALITRITSMVLEIRP